MSSVPGDTPAAAVTLTGVGIAIGGVPILQDVSAAIPAGSLTMIVGPNGSGKTSLLLAILGLVRYTGTIQIATGPNGRRLRCGYVPQRLDFDRNMPVTVAEFMASAQSKPLWLGVSARSRDRAAEMLEIVEGQDLIRKPLGGLSGGELQRVLLAYALLDDPELLLLDEPTAGMDLAGERMFCELVEDLRRRRSFTQVMVSHDLATVAYHATHVLCLHGYLVASGPPREVLTKETLARTFGPHLGLVDFATATSAHHGDPADA